MGNEVIDKSDGNNNNLMEVLNSLKSNDMALNHCGCFSFVALLIRSGFPSLDILTAPSGSH